MSFLFGLFGSDASPTPANGGAAIVQPLYPSVRLLGAVLAGLDATDPDAWAAVLAPACQRHEITTAARVAPFLGNVLHETSGFRALREDLNYAADALESVFKGRITAAEAAKLGRAPGRPALTLDEQLEIAELVYGGEWGLKNLGNKPGTTDARQFIGRGLVQLTGRSNYQRLATATKRALSDLPDWIETLDGAAESAAAYWAWTGCNAAADAGNTGTCRRLVAGCYIGVADVMERQRAAVTLLNRYGSTYG